PRSCRRRGLRRATRGTRQPCRSPCQWVPRCSAPPRAAAPLRLADIMRQVPVLADRATPPTWRSLGALEIAGITADSRRVAPGFLFAALPGGRADGRAFIAEAVSRGAVAVLAPEGTAWPPGVPPRPLLQDPEPRRRLAQLAAGFAGPQPQVV